MTATASPTREPLRRGSHWWSPAPLPRPRPKISTRRAYAEALGVYLAFFGASIVIAAGTLTSFKLTNPEGWWITGSDGFNEVALAGLAVLVVVLLANRRGRSAADIGLVAARAKGGPGMRQGIRMAAWAALGLVVGSLVTSALATGSFPFGHQSAANTVVELLAALNAGIVEETVVLAFLVTTLEQAGRPRGEIAVVALVCRGAYHIYYGPGALGILIWAAVFLWLFWRFRSVVPMIIVHVCWDSLVFLTQVSTAFGALLVLGILALAITAFVLWLVDRSGPPAPSQPSDQRHTAPTGPAWAAFPPAAAYPVGPPSPDPAPSPSPEDHGGWGPPAGR
jgi:hypothetical protein